ncbi:MAG: isoleucine--tRNA ligase [Acidobacteriota bacterium]
MTKRPFPEVPGGYPFPKLELETLEAWKRDRIFEKTLEQTASGKPFVFYEGPPTANNVPHVGHVVTRVVKDLFPRFRTMQGHYVARKAGWDTHGLAVEIEVEKRLGFSGKQQIEAYGIEAFNRACLESVNTYEQMWRTMSERVGYWMDFDDAYWTYNNEYIESLWWALRRLWDDKLLVENYKIQPYCARCGTTLSSHEVAQNYKEADDPSIWTLFRLRSGSRVKTLSGDEIDLSGAALVGWTTTPWTTLGNAGVAAHPNLEYKVIERPGRVGEPVERLIFGAHLGTSVPLVIDEDGKRKQLDLREQPAIALFSGRELDGLLYDKLFTYVSTDPGRVVLGDYVTETEGTGLVHTAPAFGEDDYQTGQRCGLPVLLTIDPQGRIAAGSPWDGTWFKEADPEITRDLKARGLLLHGDRYKHNYPFCWRCDRPLLYYANKNWFIRTTAKKAELVANNQKIHWHPEHIGEGRFGNWLENVVDWALSRKRYWGTPLPIWRCDASGCDHAECLGSFAELHRKTGQPLPANVFDRQQFDPHRPFIDRATWSCTQCGQGTMRRVDDVIDAWFDSGAMPFAQHHYMGEPLPQFDPTKGVAFPADFIAEAVDQTRGWFYTLHALGTLLFGSEAYRHCVVMGHVNDDQGRKMSKRLGNVVEPMAVIAETGADAMRWYFYVNDPEIPSRFSARLVREAAQGFLMPLWNALSFFTIYANIDGWHPGRAPEVEIGKRADLDRWILLRLDDLLEATTLKLESYDMVGSARGVEAFLDDLTNWYIRRSRERFWSGNPESGDKEAAYQTLHEILVTLAKLLAPFTPFVAEALHERLVRSQNADVPASVHLEPWPAARGWIDRLSSIGQRTEAMRLVSAMALAKRIVGLGRAARSAHELKTRQPLAAVTLVFAPDAQGVDFRDHVERVRDLVLEELNVKEIRWAERLGDFVHRDVRPDFRALGKKLGKRMKAVQTALAALDGDTLADTLERDGKITLSVEGETVELENGEVEVRLIEKAGLATAGDRGLLVALDTTLTAELIAEGHAREVVNRIQTARKEAGLDYADRIHIRFHTPVEALAGAVSHHREYIAGETLALGLDFVDPAEHADLKSAPVDDHAFAFAIRKAD